MLIKLVQVRKLDLTHYEEFDIYINPLMVKAVRFGDKDYKALNVLLQMEGGDIDINRIYIVGDMETIANRISNAISYMRDSTQWGPNVQTFSRNTKDKS